MTDIVLDVPLPTNHHTFQYWYQSLDASIRSDWLKLSKSFEIEYSSALYGAEVEELIDMGNDLFRELDDAGSSQSMQILADITQKQRTQMQSIQILTDMIQDQGTQIQSALDSLEREEIPSIANSDIQSISSDYGVTSHHT